jgi:hypothetical protein
MRYAALVTASVAVVAVMALPRDGRSESAASASPAAAPAQARPAAERAATQEDFRWSGRIAQGKEIEIAGLLGNVRAEHTSGDQVEVVGRRVGDDADQVRIEVVQEPDGDVVICTIYPVRPGSRGNRDGNRAGADAGRDRGEDGPCRDGHSGDLALDADEARIDFTVRVPEGVHLAARTVDGDIEATNLRSPVDAASVSGNVRVSTTGTARAATVSGNVEAAFGETDGDEMEFASVSGNVVVRVANGVGAEVEAHTLSGNIESDFDLRIRGGNAGRDNDNGHFHVEIGRQATGTIGSGGPELSLNTVSGNIRLLRNR